MVTEKARILVGDQLIRVKRPSLLQSAMRMVTSFKKHHMM